MNKVAHYLQEHLLGEVTTNSEVRRYFAFDKSILHLAPAIVAYPRTEEDIRKTANFCWQLAKRGQIIPITPRGAGTDTSGAAIGPGIMLVFPAHLNKILNLDVKKKTIAVEPGVTYDVLTQTLFSHQLFLPPQPNQTYATIGGGVANNSFGEKSVKYGPTKKYVRSLRVVLANGEVIETGPLNKRELSRKMGLTTFEGEIYRALDKLLEENQQIIQESRDRFTHIANSAGYNIFGVKSNDNFDLTPLIVGSQGTLAVISEATLAVENHNPQTTLCLASLPKLDSLAELLPQIKQLKPSVLDFINQPALQLIASLNPNELTDFPTDLNSAIHLIIEFDHQKSGQQKDALKKLDRLITSADGTLAASTNPSEQAEILKIKQSPATIVNFTKGPAKAVPVAEAVAVPDNQVYEYLRRAYDTYHKVGLPPAAWGQIGSGIVRFQPLLDLAKVSDRQKLFKISDSLYSLAVKFGGSITAGAGDGRLRAPYLKLQYGESLLSIMQAVKKIFDPYGLLNPGVKTATPAEVKGLMRTDYSPGRHFEHLYR